MGPESCNHACQAVEMNYVNYNAYLTNRWNLLDLTVLLCAIPGFFLPDLKVTRVLRALRPLRLAVRIPPVRLVMESLVVAIPHVLNTLVVCFILYFVMGVVGVHLFSGLYYSCQQVQ